jgi:hypothetical protein
VNSSWQRQGGKWRWSGSRAAEGGGRQAWTKWLQKFKIENKSQTTVKNRNKIKTQQNKIKTINKMK